MAVDNALPDSMDVSKRKHLKNAIQIDEGKEIFKLIFHNPNPQIIVSTRDINARIKSKRQVTLQANNIEETSKTTNTYQRPMLTTDYVKPSYKIEVDLAEIWRLHLGTKDIGIHDNFFELGGDSLLLTRVVAKINRHWAIRLSIKIALENSTVADLSLAIISQMNVSSENDCDEYEEVIL